MAKYECTVKGDFNDFLSYIDGEVLNGSVSASYEDGCTYHGEGTVTAMRVYERYSYAGGNRVSMSLLLTSMGDGAIRLCAVTSGGSRALFFKINTWGEESFLDTLISAVEKYSKR